MVNNDESIVAGPENDQLCRQLRLSVSLLAKSTEEKMILELCKVELPGIAESSIELYFDEYFANKTAYLEREITQGYNNLVTGKSEASEEDIKLCVKYCAQKYDENMLSCANLLKNVFDFIEEIYKHHFEIMKTIVMGLINTMNDDSTDPDLKYDLQEVADNLNEVVEGKDALIQKLQSYGINSNRINEIVDFLFDEINYAEVEYKTLRDYIALSLNNYLDNLHDDFSPD